MENKQYIIYAKRKVNQIKDIVTKERMQIDVVNISNPTECYGRRWDQCWVDKEISIYELFSYILPHAKQKRK